MEEIQLAMILLNGAVLTLAVISLYYFVRLMRVIKIRRGSIFASSAVFLFIGYVFFILPWITIGSNVTIMEQLAYTFILIALVILFYGVIRIYRDWREVIS
jgi:apolipoprotein N-acyltransferase